MVPGVEVAQLTSNTWAISVRGFDSRFSNKLLILLDGRAVYTPTIGGVFWDVLNLPLEDIEKIEVIRGPGGSVWGANAVDGVINIITAKASDTHGGLVTAGGGNLEQGFGTVQYGGNLANKADYRIYAKYQNDGHLPNGAGQDGGDGWHLLTGGFSRRYSCPLTMSLLVRGSINAGEENIPASQLASISSSPIPQFTDAPANLSGGYSSVRVESHVLHAGWHDPGGFLWDLSTQRRTSGGAQDGRNRFPAPLAMGRPAKHSMGTWRSVHFIGFERRFLS